MDDGYYSDDSFLDFDDVLDDELPDYYCVKVDSVTTKKVFYVHGLRSESYYIFHQNCFEDLVDNERSGHVICAISNVVHHLSVQQKFQACAKCNENIYKYYWWRNCDTCVEWQQGI